jgi:hypothetical protein
MLFRHRVSVLMLSLAVFGASAAAAGAQSAKAQSASPVAAAAVTDADRKLDCAGLRSAVAELAFQIRQSELQAANERSAPAASLAAMFARIDAPPGKAAQESATANRRRSNALVALAAGKGCGHLDGAEHLRAATMPGGQSISGLGKPAAASLGDRCPTHNESALEDCVEDIAMWRCRSQSAKGRDYVLCLDAVALKVVAASGFERAGLRHYQPGCADAAAPGTCTVFSNSRGGPVTQWCKRTSETAIEVCDPPKAVPAAAAPAAPTTPAAAPVKPVGVNCRPVACKLGHCNRLCGPPG